MSKLGNPFIFLSGFVLLFSLTVQSTQADVYESVYDPKVKAFGNRVCTNPECTILAANFINHGNEKIKPCDSFAQFTCDRYQLFKKENPLHTTASVTNKRLELLVKAPSTEDKPYHTLMKTFYDKCVKQDKNALKSSLLAWMDDIGGWPLLKPQTWVAFDGTFEKYIANIQKKYAAPILFHARVLPNINPGNKDENMLYFAPATEIQTNPTMLLGFAKKLGADHSSSVAEINEMHSKIDKKRQELLDNPKPRSNRFATLDIMKKLVPTFDLEKYVHHFFDGIAEVNSNTLVAMDNVEYFQDIHTLFTDKRVFANYAISVFLSSFLETQKGCLTQTRNLFDYPLSQLYVKNHFDPAAVPKVAEMIKLLKDELHEVIEKANWLDDTTRSFALKKLAHLKIDIGYPENLFDDAYVSGLYTIPPSQPSEDYATLLSRVQRHLHLVQLSRISTKRDRTSWKASMSVTLANAANMPTLNRIWISAGILTLPHFSPNLPDYINYGIVGQIVAHEIVHSYDDMGREYDETGTYLNWWEEETADVYKAKSECFVKQYDKENYDGKRSLGENIADNGGMKLAFKAYKKLMASRGDVPEPALPGFEEFTPEKMFFMAYANTWCDAGRRKPNDKHPPGETRLKVVLQNIKEFSKTFACPKKAPMNPDERCSLW